MRPSRRWSRKIAALAFLLTGITLAALSLRPVPEREEHDAQRLRQEWFYRQRAYPHRYVPTGARQRALRQLEGKLVAENGARARLPEGELPSIPSWSFAGPQPIQ